MTRNTNSSWARLRLALALATTIAATVFVSSAPSPLSVVGKQLLDASGQRVRLRGANCASLEWSDDGDGHIVKTFAVLVRDWHANLVRLPLGQDRWFGRAPGQADGGSGYRALVKQLVGFCAANNVYIILDLHWSDAGEWGRHIGQHNLPDQNSVVFWHDLAPLYKDNPAVLFDLYNEPANTDWDHWFKGGRQVETDQETKEVLTYDSVGMQALVDAIRATGANNVIVAGGINWAYQVDGILDGRELSDPRGRGIVYAAHPYPHEYQGIGRETIAQWTARMEAFARKLPIIVTEFGSLSSDWPFPKDWNYTDEKWNREMIRVLEAQHWNWTAWDFHPAAKPCLISGWDYAPTPEFGLWVQRALQNNVRP